MKNNLILRAAVKPLIAPIVLFALYVQFHGDFGPGGGFQAGVIFAAALILYALVFGVDSGRRLAAPAITRPLGALGVLLYAGVGVVSMIRGGAYLDYDVLSSAPLAGQHLGVLLVELGVGITVASVMLTIFFTFAGRRR